MVEQAGGIIKFIIQADNVELSEELQKYGKYVAVDGTFTLAQLFAGERFKPLIEAVIHQVFRGDDQNDPQINTQSQHILLHFLTNAKFLEVLKGYKSGEIKTRLQNEFANLDFKVEGLRLEIENKEEVNKRKEAIQRRIEDVWRAFHPEKYDKITTIFFIENANSKYSLRIIVQGGVYGFIPTDMKEEFIKGTKEAAKEGYALLKRNCTAVDAVEAAVRVLENNEHFNAGCGSLLNNEEEVECDAMIMEGHTLETGAVISGRHFRNPVSLARVIMKKTPHSALSGNGALKLAKKHGVETCKPEELITEQARERAKWVKTFTKKEPQETPDTELQELQEQTHSDTVSAVAMDVYGHLACAMSTGGIQGKPEGRVSDAAMVGCGGYANKTGAATVTGLGESIMKVTLAREVVFNMEKGQDAQKSAEDGLKKMQQRVDSCCVLGGAIAIDKDGNFGKHFTTSMMALAYIKDGEIEFGLEHGKFKKEPV